MTLNSALDVQEHDKVFEYWDWQTTPAAENTIYCSAVWPDDSDHRLDENDPFLSK